MQNENQLIKLRKERLQKIIDKGVAPFPTRSKRTHKIGTLIENKDEFVENSEKVIVCGRLNGMRRQGKIGFGNVLDDTGRIQLFIKRDLVGEENYDIFKLLNLGDFVQLEGECFITEKGEYSIKAHKITLLGKNLRPIPVVKEKIVDGKKVKYDEFTDIELRYRKRYLDLLLNPEIKRNFEIRAKVISIMRRILDGKGFLEVETPILQPLYGGANARPFITHHNTLDIPLYLRIATELYLKRLVVGGFERVYEIGKNFRNEGMDRTHNPEFTAFEVYQAYADYNDMMELAEELLSTIGNEILGTNILDFKGHQININRPWRRASMIELIQEQTGFDASDFNLEKIQNFYKEKEMEFDKVAGPGKLIEGLFEAFVEEKLIQPTFVTQFPREISPLAKAIPENNNLTERFEIFIAGDEYGNAFTELNDPIDQRERLEAQASLRELGDLEANIVDEDFIQALEYGMPPTGGMGIGIDRLTMLFTNNSSIKEVILFPQMKPE